jgi:serine/threonine protein kinase
MLWQMDASFRSITGTDYRLEAAWGNSTQTFHRGWREDLDGHRVPVLAVVPTEEKTAALNFDRLYHEFELKDVLDGAWAVRPLELVRRRDQTILVLEDPGGEPLENCVDGPMEVGHFLTLAIGITEAVDRAHGRGLIHKDIKPGNILVNTASGEVRLTGFA